MKQTFMTVGLVFIFLVIGCGVFGDKGVPKEQLNSDIVSKSVIIKGGDISVWDFKTDTGRCFAPNKDKTKIDEKHAELTITISAFRSSSIDPNGIETLFGDLLLKYTKENDKWVLDSIKPQKLMSKIMDQERFTKFVELQMPLCGYYRHTDY